ncbi:PAS domain-containing protein [Massilia sp. TS11]|uniref:response regulator n=1 Tax=Massilia sp. TS11 TaxID=2908003 RepID=UPI001EDC5471|nr:PAS domain-containing protein [Massilia sp. TS11]MCG2583965.1 PAS domain-containing protein [Massilia sp. TS11]
MDQDESLLEFAPEEAAPVADPADTAPPWRVLIVDDNEDVHTVTVIALRNTVYQGRKIEFIHAYSAQQGSSILRHQEDIALVLLDVVMETSDAGLRLARHIREDLDNHAVQIVLRTGQPGEAPERHVIVDYEINDYKSKSELGGTQLFTVVVSALRAYDNLVKQQQKHDALAASLAKIHDLETAINEHALVAFTDQYGCVIHVNDTLCEVTKYTRSELMGRDLRLLSSGQHPDAFWKHLWSTVSEGQTWQGEICNRAKDGSLYWSATTITPFKRPDGRLYQYISIGTDITERRRAEQVLRETEERWKFALEASGDGVWDVNFETGHVVFSRRWKTMNGYPEDAPDLALEGWKNLIHPEDRPQVEADMRAYLTGKTATYVSEHRTRCADGSWKWVLDRGLIVRRNALGKPERMVGTHTDISERKAALTRMQGGAEEFRSMVDSAPFAICVRHLSETSIVYANTAYAYLAAQTASISVERGPHDSEPGVTSLDAWFAQRSGKGPSLLHLRETDGHLRNVVASTYPLQFDGVPALVAWFVDVAPLSA